MLCKFCTVFIIFLLNKIRVNNAVTSQLSTPINAAYYYYFMPQNAITNQEKQQQIKPVIYPYRLNCRQQQYKRCYPQSRYRWNYRPTTGSKFFFK